MICSVVSWCAVPPRFPEDVSPSVSSDLSPARLTLTSETLLSLGDVAQGQSGEALSRM